MSGILPDIGRAGITFIVNIPDRGVLFLANIPIWNWPLTLLSIANQYESYILCLAVVFGGCMLLFIVVPRRAQPGAADLPFFPVWISISSLDI